jgi:DNA polymerase-4
MTNLLRKIIHIDMDAFYAAVEQRDNPLYRNKAIIVGGNPNSRGVVATCSYEARQFGVHSAILSCLPTLSSSDFRQTPVLGLSRNFGHYP